MSKIINCNKKFKPPNKIINFTKFATANYKHLNHSRIFSLKHLYLNSITILKLIYIFIYIYIYINNDDEANLAHLSRGSEVDEQWWSGQAACVNADLNSLLLAICVCVSERDGKKERERARGMSGGTKLETKKMKLRTEIRSIRVWKRKKKKGKKNV